MKAARIHGPGEVQIDDVGAPEINEKDVLIRIRACGICASDLKYIDAGKTGISSVRMPPAALGHEAAGEIVAVGGGVVDFAPGDRVAINPIDRITGIVIGNGAPEGAFAELVKVGNADQSGRLFKLPPNLSFDVAALAEPMAVGFHAANRSQSNPDSKVAILGMGPIGLATLIWLKHLNIHNVVAIDLSMERLDRARRFGADATIQASDQNVEGMLGELHGRTRRGAPETDIFIDAAGSAAALNNIIFMAKAQACITVVAIYQAPVALDLAALLTKEITLRFACGYPSEFGDAVTFLAANAERMKDYISDRFSLDEFEAAVARARDKHSCKVMVQTDT